MLKLNSCTAVCIDTENHELADAAADKCGACDFADLFILSDRMLRNKTKEIHKLNSIRDYSRFVFKDLINYIDTDHVLIFQWDGFIIDPSSWSNRFLDYDYIGAPWPNGIFGGAQVGNGGFSLRSRRLLEITASSDLDPGEFEDLTISNEISRLHPINIAPIGLARRFSYELEPIEAPTFGFHGHFNFFRVMSEPELLAVLDKAPPSFWSSGRPLRWIDEAWRAGRFELAVQIERYCRERFPKETGTWPDLDFALAKSLNSPNPLPPEPSHKEPAKTAVVVLGMHRSGTSAATNLVVELGARAASTIIPANDQNESGYWESFPVMELNDSTLRELNASWNDWLRLDCLLWTPQLVSSFVSKAVLLLDREFDGADLIALKDPRICLLYPLWRASIVTAGYSPKVVLIVRDPLEVARSLQVRDGFSLQRGVLLWLRYNLEAEINSRFDFRSILMYDHVFGNEQALAERLGRELKIDWPLLYSDKKQSVEPVFKETLRHHRQQVNPEKLSPVLDMANIALRAFMALSLDAADKQATEALEMVKQELDSFDAYQGEAIADLRKEALGELRQTGHTVEEWVTHGNKLERDLLEARAQYAVAAQDVSRLVEHSGKLDLDLAEARSQRDAHAQSSATVVRHAAALDGELVDVRSQRDAYLKALLALTDHVKEMERAAPGSNGPPSKEVSTDRTTQPDSS